MFKLRGPACGGGSGETTGMDKGGGGGGGGGRAEQGWRRKTCGKHSDKIRRRCRGGEGGCRGG